MPKCGFNKVANFLSFRLSGRFLGIASLVFSKLWHGVRNLYEVAHESWIFWKNFFAPKIRKMNKMGQRQVFFNLLKSFSLIFTEFFSIMKIYIVCYVPAKVLFLRYR